MSTFVIPESCASIVASVPEWDFLTNHAHVLLCVARDPDARLRDIAQCVGVTERAAHRMVCDLVEAGYVERSRVGRRNRYVVHAELPLRHPLDRDHAVGDLLRALAETDARTGEAAAAEG